MKKRLKHIIPIVIVIVIAAIAIFFATRNGSKSVNNDTSALSSAGEEAISDTFSVKKYIDVDDDKSKNECNDTTVYFDTIFDTYSKQGVIRTLRGEKNALLLCDWKTGKAITLGADLDNKANLPTDVREAFIYMDKIYLICYKKCYEANNFHIECSIVRADIDLTNQKTVLRFNTISQFYQKFIVDNKLYYTVFSCDQSKELSSGFNSDSDLSTMTLKSFDFTTLKSEDIYTFPKAYAQDIYCLHINDNKLNLNYSYSDKPVNTNTSYKSEIKVVDINTKKCIETIPFNGKSIYGFNNNVTYFANEIVTPEYYEVGNEMKSYNIITKKEETLIENDLIGHKFYNTDNATNLTNEEIEKYKKENEKTEQNISFTVILKNEIIINDPAHKKIYIYDLKGTLKYEISGAKYLIYDEYEDKYILSGENRYLASAFISKNDLVNGKFNPVKMQFPENNH